jgi:acylphosphatase
MNEKILYKIVVKGRVQGVGFRWNAIKEATNLGITGYVKNLSDGDVYIEAEGTKEQLDRYVEWCRNGPGMSSVKSVDVEKTIPVNFTEFTIEY